MKRFRFSLEALLTLRQRAEHQALEKYAEALLARKHALERLDTVHRELSVIWAELREELACGCSAGEIDRLRTYSRSLEEERNRRETVLQQTEVEVNRTLHGMLMARQQREAVDHFRGVQRAQYDRTLTREEQKFLDELAVQRSASLRAWPANESSFV